MCMVLWNQRGRSHRIWHRRVMGGPQWIVRPDNNIYHSHMVRVMVILGHTAMIPTDVVLENDNPLNLLNISPNLLDVGPDLLNIGLSLLNVSLDLLGVGLDLPP